MRHGPQATVGYSAYARTGVVPLVDECEPEDRALPLLRKLVNARHKSLPVVLQPHSNAAHGAAGLATPIHAARLRATASDARFAGAACRCREHVRVGSRTCFRSRQSSARATQQHSRTMHDSLHQSACGTKSAVGRRWVSEEALTHREQRPVDRLELCGCGRVDGDVQLRDGPERRHLHATLKACCASSGARLRNGVLRDGPERRRLHRGTVPRLTAGPSDRCASVPTGQCGLDQHWKRRGPAG